MPADETRPEPLAAVVMGGGPAGLMAAEVLATAGVSVTVFERMPTVGRKLLLAGRGGLNLTHSEPLEDLLARYGSARMVLEPAIRAFDPEALRAWSAGLGQPTWVGSSGRVFPADFRATPLLRAWIGRLGALGVQLRTRHEWRGWTAGAAQLRFCGPDGRDVTLDTRVTVLALGGASWPRTGSTGTWVPPVMDAGVAVAPLRPANCGFVVGWSEEFRRRFAGHPLKNVSVEMAGSTERGDLMITEAGVEGGAIYAVSASVRDSLHSGSPTTLFVDLRPDLGAEALAGRLDRRRPKDSFTTGLRRAAGLSPAAIGLLREATANSPPVAAVALAALVKAVPLRVAATGSIERAISSAGGIALGELDGSFMVARRPGVFAAGEMLDWEAPTGGYLLQACFSTGVAAARGALAWLATSASAGASAGASVSAAAGAGAGVAS